MIEMNSGIKSVQVEKFRGVYHESAPDALAVEEPLEIRPFDRDHALVLWHALHGRALAPRETNAEDVTFVDLCLNAFQLGASAD